jgi:PAS domain S-box-containing protein
MKNLLWQPTIVVATLLILLTMLLIESRSPDQILFERMHEALGNYELYDAELTRDVLSARAGLLLNYDSIAADRKHLHNTIEELKLEGKSGTSESDLSLRPMIESLESAQNEKLVELEHFKSANALLRNSLMYLTFVGPVLHIPEHEKAIAVETNHLSYAVLRYVQAPDSSVATEIKTILDRISRFKGYHTELSTLVAHGKLIITLAPQTDVLIHQIVNTTTGVRTHDLQVAVLHRANRVEERAQFFRYFLFLVSLLLLAYVIYQFSRLRTSAKNLYTTNASLLLEMNERSQAVAALLASEERFSAMSESAKEAIISIDVEGYISTWNSGAAKMFGYSAEEMVGRPFALLWSTSDPASNESAFAQLKKNYDANLNYPNLELSGIRKDGLKIPLEVSLSSWKTQEGRFITTVMRDVSERKRLEETTRQQELQLIQTNRMSVLGLLISGVAHEINNPNQLILMNSELVADACNELVEIVEIIGGQTHQKTLGGIPFQEMRIQLPLLARDIHEAAIQIRNIVDELRYFFRPHARGAIEAFDINDAAQHAIRLLSHLINGKTQYFRTDFHQNLPAAQGYAQHFEQVVVNLMVNALDALPSPNCGVTISTSFDASLQHLVLIVEDQGTGIPKENIDHLCDPFFTTKQAIGGTGLGLAISLTLIKNLGGTLRFESEVGKGTRAYVELNCATSIKCESCL